MDRNFHYKWQSTTVAVKSQSLMTDAKVTARLLNDALELRVGTSALACLLELVRLTCSSSTHDREAQDRSLAGAYIKI